MNERPGWQGPHSPIAAYGLSLAGVAIAVLVRLWLDPVLGDRLPFLTLFVAVVLAAWYGGRGPALLALVAGAIAAAFFLLEPRYSLAVNQLEYQVGLALYCVVCWASILMFESLRRARRQAEDRQRQLEQEVAARRAAERVLADREELLRLTLARIGDAVITTDAEGNVTTLNAVAQELTGWSRAEALGKPVAALFKIVHEESRLPVESPVHKALREGQVVELASQTLLVGKDGTERAIDDSAAPIRNDLGSIVGAVLTFRDISGRRQMETALRQQAAELQTLVETLPVGIYIAHDPQCHRITGNRAAYELLRIPPGTNLSTTDPERKLPGHFRLLRGGSDIPTEQLPAHRAARGEHVRNDEVECQFADGTTLHLVVSAAPLYDVAGRLRGAIAGILDVTARKQAEQELRSSQERLRLFIEFAPVAIAMFDRDMRFLAVSRRWLTDYRLEGREIIGQLHYELFPDLPERYREAHRQALNGAVVQAAEDCFEQAVDQVHWLRWEVRPWYDSGGGIGGIILFTEEITEAKVAGLKLQASEQRFQAAAEAVSGFIYELDLATLAMHVSVGLEQLLAIAPACLACRSDWESRIHAEDLPRVREDAARALRGTDRHYQVEYRVRHQDGHYLHVWDNGVVIRDPAGGALRAVGHIIDITERKHTENALRQRKEELREADQRKDEFLATLAHELRNPLAPIKNSLELMKQARGNAELLEQARATIDRQVSQMVRLIDDLLDVSRVTRGKLEIKLERVELASVVHQAVEACIPLCGDAGHELTVELPSEPIYLHADSARLAQVFGNLLGNSCKYTEPGGRIWLTAERQGSEVAVKVTDTGVGIPPEMLSMVFDLFTQVERSLERAAGGLGIGLSLVKSLVEMHGGSVTAHSDGPGQGSEFVVRLPVAIEKRVDPLPAAPASEPSPTLADRVLVVDDNRDSAESLARLLQLSGSQVLTAHDGLEAVEQAAALQPDLILLDIGLPKLNGYEACRRIRQLPSGRDMIIVALTGWGQDEDRRKSEEAGFNAHLVKPVSLATLARLLPELQAAKACPPIVE